MQNESDIHSEKPDVPSDRSLIRRMGGGDGDAATQFYLKHADGLLEIAKRRIAVFLQSQVDPEDIVQSTFKSFFKRASKGEYYAPEAEDLFNLLAVIAMRKINAKADYLQSQKRDIRRIQSLPEGEKGHPAVENESTSIELCLMIDELLEDLSEVQRSIIRSRLEGHTVDAIADKCGRSKRTVERELQSFRDTLCRYFNP